MYTSESRKIHLIKEVLQVENEDLLSKLEKVLNEAKPVEKREKKSAHDFTGILSNKDAALMIKAIEEGCEQIHPDDWK